MYNEIVEFIAVLEKFLKGRPGFSTEVIKKTTLVVTNEKLKTSTTYDGFELILYKKSTEKLGHELKYDIKQDENGNDIFVINSDASYDINKYIVDFNKSTKREVFPENICTVIICDQVSSEPYPYNLLTVYNDGKWARQDLTKSEILYAAVFDLKLGKEDAAYVFTDLRSEFKKIIETINSNTDNNKK